MMTRSIIGVAVFERQRQGQRSNNQNAGGAILGDRLSTGELLLKHTPIGRAGVDVTKDALSD